MWDGKQGIAKDDRPVLIEMIKKNENLKKIWKRDTKPLSNVIMLIAMEKKYPNLVKHLEVFWERRSEWALSFRMEIIMSTKLT